MWQDTSDDKAPNNSGQLKSIEVVTTTLLPPSSQSQGQGQSHSQPISAMRGGGARAGRPFRLASNNTNTKRSLEFVPNSFTPAPSSPQDGESGSVPRRTVRVDAHTDASIISLWHAMYTSYFDLLSCSLAVRLVLSHLWLTIVLKVDRTVPTHDHQCRPMEITTSLRNEIVTNIYALLSRIIRASVDFYVTSLINGPI